MRSFKSIKLEVVENIGILTLNRPEKSNAMNEDMWVELPQALSSLFTDHDCRAIVVTGEGKHFCAGLDTSLLSGSLAIDDPSLCPGRTRLAFMSHLRCLQDAMTACEACPCPVIAAVHGVCFGAGIDLITACDIRYATSDARFCVKEVDLAITADMGTLARLPGVVGDGVARELALTARVISGSEALSLKLVNACFQSREALLQNALHVAKELAAKSPLAVAGTKRMLLFQRGRPVEQGLREVGLWNAATLPGNADIQEVFAARVEGREPLFSKL